MSNPVGWFEIYVDDMERARTCYEAVFDTELQHITDSTEESFAMLGFLL
jgi:predicted enzyme related to lactoylglutathione lyase